MTYSLRAAKHVVTLFFRLFEECFSARLGGSRELLPRQVESHCVTLFVMAANPRTILPDEAVVSATRSKHILHLLVIEAGEQSSASIEAFFQTVQWRDIYLARNAKSFGILRDLSQMRQSRRSSLIHVSAFKQCLELGEGLGRRI